MAEGLREVKCKKQGRPRKSSDGCASINKCSRTSSSMSSEASRCGDESRDDLSYTNKNITFLTDSHGKSLDAPLAHQKNTPSYLLTAYVA